MPKGVYGSKKDWPQEHIQLLRSLWGVEPASKIADRIGGITRAAVIGKARRLGFPALSQPRSARVSSTARRKERKRRPLPDNWREVIVETQAQNLPARVAAERLGIPRRTACKLAQKIGRPFPIGITGVGKNSQASERKSIRGVKQPPLRFGLSPTTMAYEESRRENGAVSFLDRRPNQCAWPLGSPHDKPELFCGAPVARHSHFHWCIHHHNIGTVPTPHIKRFIEAAE